MTVAMHGSQITSDVGNLGINSIPDSSKKSGQRLVHQHCNGHRSHPARHGSQITSDVGNLVIVNITHKSLTAFLAGVRNGVYATVDDNSPRFHPMPLHHLRPANSNNQDVSCATNPKQVVGLAVADCHSC